MLRVNSSNITQFTHTKPCFEDTEKESQGYQLTLMTDSSYQGCHRSPCKRDYWNENGWASPTKDHAGSRLSMWHVEDITPLILLRWHRRDSIANHPYYHGCIVLMRCEVQIFFHPGDFCKANVRSVLVFSAIYSWPLLG